MAKNSDSPVSDNRLLAKIDELRLKLRGAPSRNLICVRANLNRDTLRQLELRGPEASLSIPSIVEIAKVLNVDPHVLLSITPDRGGINEVSDRPRRAEMIPVVGKVAGAVAGALALGETIDQVERPPALLYVPKAYAVYISGASMQPMHNPGDLRFIHPHRPYRAGDSVIVQTRDERGDIFGWIKIYERQQGDWLICRQLNPEGEYKFKLDTIVNIHRVLTMGEMFNK